MFEAKIIEDSMSPEGVRLTTMQLRYPRVILAEVNTHRMFSRSSSSTRAIPLAKAIEDVKKDPFVPSYWGKNQAGMQAKEPLSKDDAEVSRMIWMANMYAVIKNVELLNRIGLHKQLAGRLLEPYMWTHTVVTGTSDAFSNFFWLRDHEDAQPEIRDLARLMKAVYVASTPTNLSNEDWHLPYVTAVEKTVFPIDDLIKRSVARCARVSYKKHDNSDPSQEDDHRLYAQLIEHQPIHASPAEHIARPDHIYCGEWAHRDLHGNLRGWIQFRKTLPMEYVTDVV
jgi:thymidylate synthase ThyX